MINEFKQLFQQFSLEGLYQDENLPDTAYFSVDKADAGNFEAEALNALTTSLSAFINNLFAREELSSLTFNQDNPPDDTYQYTVDDLANLKNSMVFLSKRIDVIAPELEFYKKAQDFVVTQLNNLEGVTPDAREFQAGIKEIALASVALHLSLDTFNKQYAEKEAFLDQTVARDVEPEPAKLNDATSEVDGVEVEADALPEDNEVASDEGQADATSASPTTSSAQVGLLVTTALALACSFSSFDNNP